VPHSARLTALAEAVADGLQPDWDTAESSAVDESERAAIRHLRAISQMGRGRAILYTSSLASETLGARATLDDGATWGTLRILEKVGRGQFGDVYRAWDPALDREVALKLLRRRGGVSASEDALIVEEGRMMARVRHPNVATIFGAQRIGDVTGLWMEFVRGRTLEAELAERGPFAAEDLAHIGIELCHALAAVHDAGLVHRDVKAPNVMREASGRIVLGDFGTGRELEAEPPQRTELAGTPVYLAPEVFGGHSASRASDVYSLGVLLFHLATGTYPVGSRSLDGLRAAHAEGRRVLLQNERPDLPRALAAAIDRSLEPDPLQRYESAGAFEAALTHACSAAGNVPLAAGARVSAGQWATDSRTSLATATALAAVVALAAGAWLVDLGGVRRFWRAPTSPGTAGAMPAQAMGQRARLPQRPMGRPSRDARQFPYVDVNGDLLVWDVITGRPRRVAERTSGETIASPVMSPRGDRVAYVASTPAGGWELRVVHADGTWPSVLLANQTAYKPLPLDWSRDEGSILCRLDQRDGKADLVLVAAGGGAPRILQTFTSRPPSGASLSPDGRFVVYSRRGEGRSAGEDLFVVGVDGTPAQLLVAAGDDDRYPYERVPVWSPDGTRVLFLRESTTERQSQDAWLISVVEGVPQGDPVPFRPNLGGITAMGLTDNGALFYMAISGTAEVYTASIDLKDHVTRGAPSRISATNIGQHRSPAWSPDGASIAYYTEQPSPIRGFNPTVTLTVQDLATGTERTLTPRMTLGMYVPQWHPDSGSLFVFGRDSESNRPGLFRVDVRTSDTTLVVWSDQNPPSFQCEPGGRELFYADARGVVAHDLSSGGERIVVPKGARSTIGPIGISPDGRTVAFVGRTAAAAGDTVTLEVQAIGGTPRELLRVTPPNDLWFQVWTPDGRDILFTQWTGTPSARPRLWRIPAAGGQPRDTQFELRTPPGNLGSLSPDGRRIAYTERERFWELWIEESALQVWRLERTTDASPSERRR